MTEQTKLQRILELPFEDYMAECLEHVRQLALKDPIANIVYQHMVEAPAACEAQWARRYWYAKCGVTQ